MVELAALGKSVSGDYEPAGSSADWRESSGTMGAPRIQSLRRFCSAQSERFGTVRPEVQISSLPRI